MKPRRYFLIVLAFFGLFSTVSAQIIGDYRTNGAGTAWSNAANWDRWSGIAWVAGASYPGQNLAIALTTTTIRDGHNMILDITPANNIVNLVIGGGTSGSLTIGNNATGRTLTTTAAGAVTVSAGASLLSGTGGGSHTLSFQSTLTNNGTINFSNDQVSITVSSTTSNSGTITFGSNTGSKVFVGGVTNTGTWTSTAITSGNLIFRGGIASNGGSFTAGGATFNTTAAQSLTGSVAMSFTDIVVTGVTVTNSNTNATSGVTLSTSLTGNGTWTQGTTTNILTFGGTSIGITTFNANGAGNTVNYNGSGAQTVRVVTYHHLTISNTSAATLATAITLNGNLNVGSTASFTANAALTTVSGTTAISGSLTLASNASTTFVGTVTVSGSWTSTVISTTNNLIFRNGITNNGTFSAGSATFNDVATNAQFIAGSGAVSFANVVTMTDGSTAGTLILTNSNTNTVTISGTGAAQLTGSGTWRQGANSTLSHAGTTITGITFDATTNTPNTVIYTNATAPTTIVNFNSLTYSGSGTLTLASPNISGNLTVNTGSFAGTGTTTFSGASAQTISGTGAGTITFAALTMNTGSSSNLTVNKSISVTGAISWSANGLIVLGASADLTLGTAASITSPNASRYIQTDGTTSSNSNLIRTTTNAITQWQFTFPVGTSTGGYTPLVIPTITTAPANNSTLAVKPFVTTDIDGRLKRQFRLTVAGNANATTFSGGVFSYIVNTPIYTDVSATDVETDYTTAWRYDGTSWTSVASSISTVAHTFTVTGGSAATASLTTGTYYYTIGSVISSVKSWYSYQTGNYSDYNTWTLDPSGSTFDNPQTLYPSVGDDITILNGFTVTVDVSGQSLVATEIEGGGTLDMGTSTGQTLGTITGTGLLRMNGVNLPTGTYTDFVSTIGGTIEYYDIGGNLPTTAPTATPTYNKLKLTNSTGSNINYILISNLIVNGTFDLSTTGAGTVGWQINDASNNQRTITLNGDLTVASGGRITVGTGNEASTSPHAIAAYGNFTNNGIVKFYDDTDTELAESDYGLSYPSAGIDLHRNELQGNAANVTFTGTSNKTVTCNNKTDFYRFILNKGTGQIAILTVNSANTAYFRLFGPSDIGSSGNGTAPNEYSADALSIINGILNLTGSINLPFLILNPTAGSPTNDYFSIPQNGQLWLNGAGVTVTLTDTNPGNNSSVCNRLMLSGNFKITNGTFNSGVGGGIGSEDGGAYLQDGGTVNTWQFRPRAAGTGIFSFNMTGGTLNVGYGFALSGGYDNGTYCRFDMRSSSSTFQMSGGVLNIAKATSQGGFWIGSSSANYSVSGGTINAYTGNVTAGTDNTYYISSTAPLYNLNINRESGSSIAQILSQSASGGPPPIIASNSLTIQNNLTLVHGASFDPTFSCNNLNLSVGGNFDIQTGTTFTPGTSIVTLNGSGAQTWTHNGTITSLASVVMNKSAGTLTLAGSQTFPNITTALTLTSGTLADGGKTITVTGALTNNATHSGAGSITYSNGATSTIGGSNGTFGNLTLTTNFTHSTSGAQTITGTLRLTGNTILNIGANSLTTQGNIYSDGTTGTSFSATKMIITNGFHNAGGLTRQGIAGALLFPLGTGSIYTPNTITVAATTYGTITVRPVASEHPNVTTTAQGVRYYWRVTSSGFSAITSVSHSGYDYSTAIEDNPTANYRSARFDASALSWATNNTVFNATSSPPIPAFNTGTSWAGVTGDQLDGEYTCGNVAAFGNVTTYYSKASGAWNLTSTWSNTGHAGANASVAPPCATCPVIIGNGSSFNHTVTIDANSRSCGTLAINTGSTLDLSTFNTLNFGTNTGGAVTGTGTLRIGSSNFPSGDFTNFLGSSGGTVEWYLPSASGLGLIGALAANTSTGLGGMTAGTYTNVASVSGGTGTGARFTVVVANATTITSVTTTTPGSGYVSGDVLTFNGSQFGAGGVGSFTRSAAAANISYVVPTTGPSPQSLSLATYYNVIFNPAATFTINLPATNLTVYNNWTQQTGTGTLTNNGSRTLAITGNLTVSAGTFSLTNSGNTTLTVGGAVSNSGTFTTPSGTHTLSVVGGFTNNGTITFNGAGGTVALTFTGSSNVNFSGTGSGGTTLYLLTVNKGSSSTPTLTFNVSGTVTTTATTTGWLTITNGTFDWANASTTSISTQSYTINSTAKLKVSSGIVNATSGDNDAYDLFLNGALEVAGGTMNVGNNTVNTNNVDIEYGSAGVPAITVSSGTLWVKGSVRRSSNTITGALNYTQTGGAVTVGGISSTDVNDRGVFEIDSNTGSNFTLTGTSTLTVQRQTGGTGYADLYLNPVTSNVTSGTTITVGLTTATTQANLRINVAPSIGSFSIANGAGTNAQTVNMYSNPLLVTGNLTIPTPSVLVTNSLDVSIAGDLTGTGTYTGGTNTTTFNGTGAQAGALSATSTFYNFTVNKTAGTTLTLSGTSPSLRNLNILSGTLNVGSLALSVTQNITNNSTQTGAGSVLLNCTTGISNTITSSGGTFTNLTIGGAVSTRTISVVGDMAINGTLTFSTTNRYLNIGSYQLTFGPSATAVSGAGATAFILTNGVSSDLGVVKTWGSSGTFVYQVGGGLTTNYTPVSFSLNVTASGTLGVTPVNSAHPTSSATGEQLLNYYWTVTRGSTLIATVTANHTYTYASTLIVGSGGTIAAGYLDVNNPVGWVTSGHGGSATTTQMDFTNAVSNNIPSAGFAYDYTVGTSTTLPNPIVPLYSRLSTANVANSTIGGSWNVASSWTTDSDGDLDGNNQSAVAPNGVPVVILSGARINTNINGRKAFKTTINGLLNNGTKTGHSFGIISGTGTFRTGTNTFPAGNYTAFVASGGGTIEYVAPMTMNSRSTYNNLSVYSSSSGTVTMTNTDLILNGSLTIPSGVTLNNPNNNNMSIAGNWNNNGTITFGTGAVTFNGSAAQAISGANTFNTLTVNNSGSNLTLSGTGSTVVSSGLTLTNGNIISSSANTLALGTATLTGGSASSYIAGPFTKTVGASTTFNIPVGSITPARYRPAVIANTSGSDDWSFEYVGSNPSGGGYSSKAFNSSNIGTVSGFEYWLISRSGATSADVTLSYGSGSYFPPNIGTVANLRVVHWDAAALPSARWDLPSGGGTQSQSGTNLAGTVSVTNVTSFSPVTVGSTDTNSPLPITLVSFTGRLTDDGVLLKWKTLTEINNDYFEIEKSATGEAFSTIAKINGAGTSLQPKFYEYVDADVRVGKTYYRLKQVDYSGKFDYSDVIAVDYSENGNLLLSIYPNPAQGKTVTLEVSGLKDLTQLPILITDQIGREVLSGKMSVSNGASTVTIPVENLANGVYLLKVGTSNQLVRRIVIAH